MFRGHSDAYPDTQGNGDHPKQYVGSEDFGILFPAKRVVVVACAGLEESADPGDRYDSTCKESGGQRKEDGGVGGEEGEGWEES